MENVLIRARVDIGFSGEIIGRHTNLLLSNINFVPIISSKRFALFLNSFELVFAMPSLILRKEVLHFIKKTKNTLVSPISQTWNIFVHLSTYKHVTARFIYQMTVPVKQREIYSEPIRKVKTTENTETYPKNLHALRILCGSFEDIQLIYFLDRLLISQENNELQNRQEKRFYSSFPLVRFFPPVSHKIAHQVPIVDYGPPSVSYSIRVTENLRNVTNFFKSRFSPRSFKYTVQRGNELQIFPKVIAVVKKDPSVTHQVSDVNYRPPAIIQSAQETKTFSSSKQFFKPVFKSYSIKGTVQRGNGLRTQRVIAGIKKELYTAYQLSTINYRSPAVSYNLRKADTTVNANDKNNIYSNSIKNKEMLLNIHGIGEEKPLLHTYPKMEHLASNYKEIIKERVIEKEVDSKPPKVVSQSTTYDINHIANQVFSIMERKIKVEKERRGLYG